MGKKKDNLRKGVEGDIAIKGRGEEVLDGRRLKEIADQGLKTNDWFNVSPYHGQAK